MDELESIKKMLINIPKNELDISQKEILIKPIESAISDMKTLLEKLKVFASPDIEEVIKQIKEKYSLNIRYFFIYLYIGSVLFPLAIFSIIGYYVGADVREVEAKNKAQSELEYVNSFSKEIYKSGVLDSLTIQYSPSRNSSFIVCKEGSGKCVTRYDENTSTGYIEVKNAK
jgi:hypothetical protein